MQGCATSLPVDAACGVITDSLGDVHATTKSGDQRISVNFERGVRAGCWTRQAAKAKPVQVTIAIVKPRVITKIVSIAAPPVVIGVPVPGPAGPTGPQGEAGQKGEAGPQGDAGQKGEDAPTLPTPPKTHWWDRF